MKKDIEKYINDGIKAETPSALSKENIVKMIDTVSQEPKLKKRKRVQTVYKFAAVAAALAIVLSGISIYGSVKKPKSPPLINNGTVSVPSDDNYDEIYDRLKKMKASINPENGGTATDNNVNYGVLPGDAFNRNEQFKDESAESSVNKDFGTTNTQEENVDEGDIIKTDGKNIYLADRDNKRVYVVKADGGKMNKLSEIRLSGNVHIQEMYLTGSTLALIYSEYDYSKQPALYNKSEAAYYDTAFRTGCCAVWAYSDTKISFYDVSNPENVRLISNYSQSGEFTSSRMCDGKLYLVSSYGVDLFAKDYKKKCIPETAENGVKERIHAGKITLVNGTETPTYAVICTFDVKNAKRTDSSAIFGDPTHVYATENSFFLVESRYDGENGDAYLNILKFEFTESGVKYLSSAKADGSLNSNLSMSEYKGFFRIATTCNVTEKKNGVSSFSQINKLYIFDSEMNQTGIIDGFAKNEEIRSARYAGDYAYVVTFQRTDPLFVINLSDPKNPKIEGELKLPGFSSYLHPVGEGLLVGVGYDGDENNSNNNMKVSLFSVSDPKNPKELSSVKVGNENDYISSDVFYSYKAFVNLPNGEFAVPLSLNYNNQMFIRYRVSDGTLSEVARLNLGNDVTDIVGGTYIGDYFYIFSSEFIDGKTSEDIKWKGRLTSFDLTTNSKTNEIEL